MPSRSAGCSGELRGYRFEGLRIYETEELMIRGQASPFTFNFTRIAIQQRIRDLKTATLDTTRSSKGPTIRKQDQESRRKRGVDSERTKDPMVRGSGGLTNTGPEQSPLTLWTKDPGLRR
mmetsp:Transcript_46756/g.73185  ORF Transcript_46756/g.73185 Transcript_46756/m.73185 type:complete len:120 (+) Transcript_46756:536-895(+)